MRIVYAVLAVLFSAIAWICTQTIWEYQWILEYVAIFIASLFVALVFVYQEEGEENKKYTLFTPYNIIYIIVILIVIFVPFRNYSLENWQTVTQSFWKAIFCLNGVQGVFLMAFYKIRDWYYHM